MYKYRIVVLIICLVSLIKKELKAQQPLIPNGGFEDYSQLPTDTWQWHYCLNWTNASRYSSNTASPDYFHVNGTGHSQLPNSQLAHVPPHSGNGIMGFITIGFGAIISNYREYITNQLTEPLIPGVTYELSFWLCNGDKNWTYQYKSNNIGVHFSRWPLWQTGYAPMNLVPQYNIDQVIWNTDWVEYTYTFVADTTHQYIIIGNFYPDSSTIYLPSPAHASSLAGPSTYYFIDDVILKQIDRLQVNGNDTICEGDSLTLSAKNSNQEYIWVDSNLPDSMIHQGKIFTATPNETTTYKIFAGYDTTSFTVHVIPNPYANINLGESITLCQDELFTLDAGFPNADYLWQDGSTESTYTVSDSGWYHVQVSNECGIGIDSVFIAERECFLYLPDAFSPNEDGQNDIFKPLGIDALEIQEFRIYNRWGQEVYVGDDLENGGWDGTFQGAEQRQEVYVYTIVYIRDREFESTAVKGTVSLFR